MLLLVPACTQYQFWPKQRDLKGEIEQLREQNDEIRRQAEAERVELMEQHALEIAAEKERYAAIEVELAELRGLNDQRASGIQQSFFGGDIIYVVAPEGYSDYRAALRYRSLNDAQFERSLETYEKRMGGDADVLRVLQEMDFSQDQLITKDEAQVFKSTAEKKYRPPSGRADSK